jgi:hypothetical protein
VSRFAERDVQQNLKLQTGQRVQATFDTTRKIARRREVSGSNTGESIGFWGTNKRRGPCEA